MSIKQEAQKLGYEDYSYGTHVTISVQDLGAGGTAYTSMEVEGGYWGEVGYTTLANGREVPFFQVWDEKGGELLFDFTKINFKLAEGSEHTFEMSWMQGTKGAFLDHTWVFEMDGKKLGTYDMGGKYGEYINAGVETSTGSVPHTVDFSNWQTWETLNGAMWETVPDANWLGSSQNGAGAVGNVQDPSIPLGDFSVGDDLQDVNYGTLLWSDSFSAVSAIPDGSTLWVNDSLSAALNLPEDWQPEVVLPEALAEHMPDHAQNVVEHAPGFEHHHDWF